MGLYFRKRNLLVRKDEDLDERSIVWEVLHAVFHNPGLEQTVRSLLEGPAVAYGRHLYVRSSSGRFLKASFYPGGRFHLDPVKDPETEAALGRLFERLEKARSEGPSPQLPPTEPEESFEAPEP